MLKLSKTEKRIAVSFQFYDKFGFFPFEKQALLDCEKKKLIHYFENFIFQLNARRSLKSHQKRGLFVVARKQLSFQIKNKYGT